MCVTSRAMGAVLVSASLACSSSPDPWEANRELAVVEPTLTGAAFDARRQQIEDARVSLRAIRETLESLSFRPQRPGHRVFRDFVEAYIGFEVVSLAPTTHPGLVTADASLWLLHADVLVAMDQRDRADELLERLSARFEGNRELIVEDPTGTQRAIGDAISRLSAPWWR